MPTSHADSARKGKAVEHLVAATCILASNFQLNALTALVDDEGVDIVFNRRGGSRTLAVQVKSRFWDAASMASGGQFITDIRDATFRPRTDLYLLFVAVDPSTITVAPIWLIPSEHFGQVIAAKRGLRRFSASANQQSTDRWAEFKVEDSAALATRLLAVLGEI